MFVRIRWFIIGAAASFGMVAYVANQLRRVRESLTAANLARGFARTAADLLDQASDRLSERSGRVR